MHMDTRSRSYLEKESGNSHDDSTFGLPTLTGKYSDHMCACSVCACACMCVECLPTWKLREGMKLPWMIT